MDKEIEQAIDAAANRALEAVRPYFDAKVEEVKRHMDVQVEVLEKEIKGLGDLVQRDDEKMEDHEKRIGRLEDHAGLPALEPAVE